MNIAPISEPNVIAPATKATQNVRCRASRRSTRGRGARACHQKKPIVASTATLAVMSHVTVTPESRVSMEMMSPPTPRTDRMPPQ